MPNDAIPVLVDDEEATTPVPRQSMAELVYGGRRRRSIEGDLSWDEEEPEHIAGAEFHFEEPAQAEHDGEDYL